MNFWQRLSLAWRVAFSGQKAIATMLPSWQEMTPSYGGINFENMVKQGWRKNELIFACINKTANTASSVHLVVKQKGSEEPLANHPLARLIARPNPFMTEFDFWTAVTTLQKLAGDVYFEKERSRSGQVIALWPLRPDWVTVIRSSQKMIGGYEYGPPGLTPVTLRPEDVLRFKTFDPLNMYQGWPPVAVAARVGDVDNATTDHLKLFFEKGGMPAGLLKTKQKLQDTDVTNIRRRWAERYGGHEHWLEPAVLDSDAEYQQVASSFKEMGFDVLDSRSEARICQVLDVPPILVGAKVGLDRATYSNYKEARSAWWEDSLMPMYQHYDDPVQNDLAPEFGDNLLVEWDFSGVPALQEERNGRWERATAAFEKGALTLNEFYQEVGLPAIGKLGDVYLRPNTVTPVLRSEFDKMPEPAAVQPIAAVEEEMPEDEGMMGKARLKKVNGRPPDEAERLRFEKKMERIMRSYFAGQLGRIEKEMGGGQKVHSNGTATA
jgi:HK97 family phage portal protein